MNRRSVLRALPFLVLLLLVCLPTTLSASTTAPPPFDFINGLISFIRRAAGSLLVLAMMIGAISWLFVKNGEGIVQWLGKALVAGALVLGAGVAVASIGFEGAVV